MLSTLLPIYNVIPLYTVTLTFLRALQQKDNSLDIMFSQT